MQFITVLLIITGWKRYQKSLKIITFITEDLPQDSLSKLELKLSSKTFLRKRKTVSSF